MPKFYKILISFLLLIALCTVAVLYYLSHYLNELKPVIEKEFEAQTGYALQIQSIHFYKKSILSFSKLEMTGLTISDKKSKRQLTTIDSVTLSIKLYRLLFKQLVIGKMSLNTVVQYSTGRNSNKRGIIYQLSMIIHQLRENTALKDMHSFSLNDVSVKSTKGIKNTLLKHFSIDINPYFKTVNLNLNLRGKTKWSASTNYQLISADKIQLMHTVLKSSNQLVLKLQDVIIESDRNNYTVNGRVQGLGRTVNFNYSLRDEKKHSLTVNGNGIDVVKFYKLFTAKSVPFRSGIFKLNIKLSTLGLNSVDILKQLQGRIYLHSNNIIIENKKLSHLGNDIALATVQAFLSPFKKQKKTDKLTCVTLNLPIKHGAATFKNNLALETASIVATAQGSVSLVNNSVNMKLFLVPRKEIIMSLSSFSDKIVIQGSIFSPKVSTGSSSTGLLKTGANVGAAVVTGGLSLLAKGLYSIAVQKDFHPCLAITR